MKRIKYIIKKEFLQIRRDRAMIGVMFMMPLVQLLILGYVVSSEVRNIRTVICDLDRSPLSRQLVDRIKNSGYFDVRYHDARENQVGYYLDSGRASVALIIPASLSKKLHTRVPTQLQILLDGQDANTATITLGYVSGILENFLAENLQQQMLQASSEAGSVHLITPAIRIWYNEELKYSNFMIPGLVVLLLTMVTSLISAMGLVREREIGTLEQLLVAPIKKYELLIGKLVPFAIIGLMVLSLAIGFAKVWYQIPIVGNLGLFFLFAIIYLFTTLGIGLFVSASAHTQQQAMFMTFFFLIFFLIMSGFLFQIENMPKPAQYLSYLDPMRYLIVVVREIFIKGTPAKYLYDQGVALIIFGSIIFTGAVLRFQRRMK
ncbi:ABC transporter permease [candidate division KSB1 bacterium]|nr:ABC transporter permease [candidate division KSB1 bacterium]